MKPESNSFLIRASAECGSAEADWRLSQIKLEFARLSKPGLKPSFKPEMR